MTAHCVAEILGKSTATVVFTVESITITVGLRHQNRRSKINIFLQRSDHTKDRYAVALRYTVKLRCGTVESKSGIEYRRLDGTISTIGITGTNFRSKQRLFLATG